MFPRIRVLLPRAKEVLALLILAHGVSGAEPPLAEALQRPAVRVPGHTLFETLPPTVTGLSAPNHYNDPRMWRENYRELSLGAIGTGIAIGDYDGDGRPDIYVACKVEGNHLFHNEGNFRFTDVTERAGVAGPSGPWKQGVTWVDVDNDGKLDLYVCRFGAPNLLFMNQGDGTFKEDADARGLAVTDASNQAAWCDYDRDGFIDVYLQTNVLDCEAEPNGQRDYLFHNNGDGTFSNVTDPAGIRNTTQGHAATWWDFDEDGWPDIYVDNDFKDPDQLYHNNGDGTFTNVLSLVVSHTPDSSMGADLGDINNDGHIDLLVADMAATTRYKDQQGMAKLRADLPSNDTTPRLAPQYMRNSLFVNTGAGRMLEAAFLTGLNATDWTWSVRLEDLDNDGRLDAFFTNGTIRRYNYVDLVKKANACESDEERIRLIKASPPLEESHLAFRNKSDLEFENVSKAWGLDHFGVGSGAAFGDLDGDGDLDLVFATVDREVTVCRNNSDTGHRVLFNLRGSASNRFGIGSLVSVETASGTQTRSLVLARGYLSSSEPSVHFGLGNDERVRRVTIRWPSGLVQELRDLPADNRFTIEEPRVATPAEKPPALPSVKPPSPAARFENVTAQTRLAASNEESSNAEMKKQPLLTIRQNRQGPAIAIGDLDEDGEPEVILGGTSLSFPRMFSNLGQGSFLGAGNDELNTMPRVPNAALLLFDANGDGHTDLFVAQGGNDPEAPAAALRPVLFLGDGKGHFTAAPANSLPDWAGSAGTAVAADFNRDGKLDVFVGGRLVPGRYPEAPTSALFQNNGGTFTDVTDAAAPGLKNAGRVTSALWSDVDGDGWLDLVLALEWGTIRYWHNQGGHGFEDFSDRAGFSATGSGWWNSIASADFNGDGRPDYAIGNLGLNTPYQADAAHPFSLYSGSFDASGRTSLIEAQYEGDVLYPVRGPQVLNRFLPWLSKRFPTFDAYGKADLTAVFGADRLAAASRVSATEFRSGVLFSQSDGTYRFAPLPRIAQIAPVYGMTAADFDGDGHTDVLLVQNSFAPIGEVGRFDGGLGLLLRGDGAGNLLPVSPGTSGWLITGDAKGLATFDFNHDGWPDLLVSRSNDESQAWSTVPLSGHRSFAVTLKGPLGNAHGVGAQVTVTLNDGSRQTQEVFAGSGYHTQASPALFFGYREDVKPIELRVRWPDGHVTKTPWNREQSTVSIDVSSP